MSSRRPDLFVEFTENAMHVLDGSHGINLPLARESNGKVTPESGAAAAKLLHEFFVSHGRMTSRMAACSIPARGVSLRRMSVPAAPDDEVRRLLAMQLEIQLPVPPDELAWGRLRLGEGPGTGARQLQEFLVVAVKRDILSDYTRILADSGVSVEYTVGALVRATLCSNTPAEFSVLNSGRTRSELALFDARGPASLRVLPWGTENSAGLNGALKAGIGQKLYVTSGRPPAEVLATAASPVEVLEQSGVAGMSAANLGLKRMVESGREPIFLGAHEAVPAAPAPNRWKWAALAAGLAFAALSLRYAEALVYRARLSNKLEAIATYKATLPKVEREFSFLHYIKTNQPPYLDTLAVVASAAPPGTKIDSLSLVRQGDLSFRGSTGDAQAPGAFRSKLIDSGFFSRVVVEEQAPIQDGQKFTFRMSAQLKPDGLRKSFFLPGATNTAATNAPNSR